MMREDHPSHPLVLFPREFTRLPEPDDEPEYDFAHPSWREVHLKLLANGWEFLDTDMERDSDPHMIEWMGQATYAHRETETRLAITISANAQISEDGFEVHGSEFDAFGAATMEKL